MIVLPYLTQTLSVALFHMLPPKLTAGHEPASEKPTVILKIIDKIFFVFLFFCFSTGLVRLYIAGLPLRSCRTIGAPSVQGSAQCVFFLLLVPGLEPRRPQCQHEVPTP